MDALNGRAKWTSMLLKMQELTFNSIPFIMTAKLKAIRADLTELLPVPRLLERRLHALYAFRAARERPMGRWGQMKSNC